MKKKIIILAVLFAILTSALVYFYLTSMDAPTAQIVMNKTEVVVAASTIPENVIITEAMLTKVSLPADAVHGDSVKAMEEVVGFLSKSEIIAGEQVLRGRVVTDLSSAALAYRIPEGMRAMSISSNEISGVAGYIAVGDRVDILVSYTELPALGTGIQVITQFQNIQVLAKGPALSGTTGAQNDTGVSTSLTLLVTPEMAEVLVYASAGGTINMTLRNPVDTEVLTLDRYGLETFDTWKSR